ncbi:MAG TPA: 50S ribosomal protein L18 [Clostridia bacterium]|nr:50S ribosomal protein L18 [Clostridia bacterium]
MENKLVRAQKRKTKTRAKLPREGYRLAISRSNRYLFAQIIEQKTGRTVLGFHDYKLLTPAQAKDKSKTQRAEEFGAKFAAEVLKKKIEKVIFDRGPYRYHGRVKAFVEGTRKAGLKY